MKFVNETDSAPLSRRKTAVFFGAVAVLAAVDTLVAKSSLIAPLNMGAIAFAEGMHVRMPWLTSVMVAVTGMGSDPILLAFVIALATGLALRKKPGEAAWIVLVTLFARFTGPISKILVQSPRPHLAVPPAPFLHFPGYGFPSGHALMSTVVFGLAALLAFRYAGGPVARTATAICAVLVLAIGFSRIYLGAHWLNDVLGGYLYGLCILALACLLRQRMDVEKSRN